MKAKLKPVTVPDGMDPEGVPEFLWWCPGCQCSHYVNVNRGKVRWSFDGNMTAPTINPSILVRWTTSEPPVTGENIEDWRKAPWPQKEVQKCCHVFIRAGMIQFLSDCTHALAGRTVAMEEF